MRAIFRELLMLAAKFLFLATFLFWAPIVLVVMCFELHFIPSEFRLKRRMQLAGRYLSPAQMRQRTPTGTFILDKPTFSWAVSRLWWTTDDVIASAPVPHPLDTEDPRLVTGWDEWHPFYRWCSDRYLCPETGCAYLVGVWHCDRLAQELAGEFRIPLVETYSGGQYLERMKQDSRMKSERAHQGAGDDQQ